MNQRILAALFVGAAVWLVAHAVLTPPAGPGPTTPANPANPKAPAAAKKQLLYFSATWCVPCKQMARTLAAPEVTAALGGYTVTKYDADRDRDQAKAHGVHGVPTYVILDPQGRELKRASGWKSPADFAAWLQ